MLCPPASNSITRYGLLKKYTNGCIGSGKGIKVALYAKLAQDQLSENHEIEMPKYQNTKYQVEHREIHKIFIEEQDKVQVCFF